MGRFEGSYTGIPEPESMPVCALRPTASFEASRTGMLQGWRRLGAQNHRYLPVLEYWNADTEDRYSRACCWVRPPSRVHLLCSVLFKGSRGDRRDASPGGSLRVRVGLPANPGRHSVPVHAHVPGHAQAPLAGPRFGDEEPRVEILVRRCRRWVFFVLCVPPPPLEAIRSELKGEGARWPTDAVSTMASWIEQGRI